MSPAKERPILFSGEMVRAILAGQKTQTRRIAPFNPNSHGVPFKYINKAEAKVFGLKFGAIHELANVRCRYGEPDDRLWVRETWQAWAEFDGSPAAAISAEARLRLNYPANGNTWDARLRPSIHMPRWASRILLEITDIRVERLQDISVADAIAEGVKTCEGELVTNGCWYSEDELYSMLWTKIHGHGSWNSNPWVWVVEFRRVEG